LKLRRHQGGYGGNASVVRVLHRVHEGAGGCPEFVAVSGGVNQGDEGLGQPRQVMTATV
jgi:hypothetical protein